MNLLRIKRTIVDMIPGRLSFLYLFNPRDISSVLLFLLKSSPKASFRQRLRLIRRLYAISRAIDCRHAEHEIITFIETILSLPDRIEGFIVEAGCYRGGSTAKFSLAVKMVNRRLIVFDSFEGLPEHSESTSRDTPGWHTHAPGSFNASLDEVISNVGKYGELEVCEFVKGWFDDTMPAFSEPISAAYLDVSLASSTRTCLKYLYPLLATGGWLYSNDGYSPYICDVFRDDEFWRKEVGYPRPDTRGLGAQKIIKITKPIESA